MKTRKKGRTITFRLYPEDEEMLREEAPPGTKSLGAVAEKLLLQKLRHNSDEELGYLRQKVVQLEGKIQSLQEELHVSVEAILIGIVNRETLSTDQVKEWIAKKFTKE
jgi:hypothetical protein